MFPTDGLGGAGEGRPCIIDWGGLQRGKGVFDVAYLIGTGMLHEERALVRSCDVFFMLLSFSLWLMGLLWGAARGHHPAEVPRSSQRRGR